MESVVRLRSTYDVIIVGSGPAGLAAALTFARYSDRRVLVLDRERSGRARGAALLHGGSQAILSYLRCWRGLLALQPQVAGRLQVSWGGRPIPDELLGGNEAAWSLPLTPLMELMAVAARARGVVIWGGASLERMERRRERWLVELASGHRLRCRALIDCSGRAALMNRSACALPEALDRAVSVSAELSGVETRGLSVEAMPTGWWLTVPLAPGRAMVRWVTDADMLVEGLTEEAWRRQMGPQTREALRRASLLGPLRLTGVSTQRQSELMGEGWVAAGSAAQAYDDLTGFGLGRSMLSGVEAARATHDALDGFAALRETYRSTQAEAWQDFTARRARCYAGMADFGPFWARRAPAQPPVRAAV